MVGGAHVCCGNRNASGGPATLYVRSAAGPLADVVVERNQWDAIRLRGKDTDSVSLDGVLLRANAPAGGGSTPVLPAGDQPGVTIVP